MVTRRKSLCFFLDLKNELGLTRNKTARYGTLEEELTLTDEVNQDTHCTLI